MPTRREVLGLGAAAVVLPGVFGCSGVNEREYAAAVARVRSVNATHPHLVECVRLATLAPNSHNTQPWLFRLGDARVDIQPDFTRACPAVDPDNHHIYVTLGCATENFLLACAAHGRPGEAVFDPAGEGRVSIVCGSGAAVSDELFAAIPTRQSTRSVYASLPVSTDELLALEAAAKMDGVSVRFFTARAELESILEFVVAGNSAQIADPAFVAELKHWLRFNASAALTTGDGLYSACSDNPTGPTWIGKMMFDMAFTGKRENAKYVDQIRSSSGVAVFTALSEGPDGWVKVGRSFERFALKATALGLKHAHINQPVEVASVRSGFASWLGAPAARPDLVIRFGYASPLPYSPRRALDSVIVPV